MRNGAINSHFRNAEAMYGRIDQATAGSNVVHGYTDQGSAGDPNFASGGTGVNINRERFNNWGYPGSEAFHERHQRGYAAANARAEEERFRAIQGSRGAPMGEPDVGPQSSLKKPTTVASRTPPTWTEDDSDGQSPLIENPSYDPFDYRKGDRPNRYLDDNPVPRPEDNPTRGIPQPLPPDKPSGIVPPTPGDGFDPKGKPDDGFSIPQDYNLG
jgi:hypothetical protein